MKKESKKLNLNKMTVCKLNLDQLEKVVGGTGGTGACLVTITLSMMGKCPGPKGGPTDPNC